MDKTIDSKVLNLFKLCNNSILDFKSINPLYDIYSLFYQYNEKYLLENKLKQSIDKQILLNSLIIISNLIYKNTTDKDQEIEIIFGNLTKDEGVLESLVILISKILIHNKKLFKSFELIKEYLNKINKGEKYLDLIKFKNSIWYLIKCLEIIDYLNLQLIHFKKLNITLKEFIIIFSEWAIHNNILDKEININKSKNINDFDRDILIKIILKEI